MNIEPLREIIRRGRQLQGLSQEQAAEAADITLEQWTVLERPGSDRRTGITLPRDRDMIGAVARVIGREGGRELLEEAGLL